MSPQGDNSITKLHFSYRVSFRSTTNYSATCAYLYPMHSSSYVERFCGLNITLFGRQGV